MLIVLSLIFHLLVQAQDQFWTNIENVLFKKVDLSNFAASKEYLEGLMERAQQLNAINKKIGNPIIIKNNQEAIEALLSVHIYVEALTRYLFLKQKNEQLKILSAEIAELKAQFTHAESINDIAKQTAITNKLKILEKEHNDLSNEITQIYSQRALIDIIKKTFSPFDFIPMKNLPIEKIAADIQNFIGSEIYFADMSLSLNDTQMKHLFRYIQIAPLLSDEYVQRNGRFYLKALDEALRAINSIVKIHQKNGDDRYMSRQQELLKKLITITAHDFITLSLLTQV